MNTLTEYLEANYDNNLITFSEWNIGQKVQVVFQDNRDLPKRLGIVTGFEYNCVGGLCVVITPIIIGADGYTPALPLAFTEPMVLNPHNSTFTIYALEGMSNRLERHRVA